MLNEHMRKAAMTVKAINAKGNGLFGALLAFTQAFKTNGVEALRDTFKGQEKLANAELKVELTKNSTYKVAKGKLIKAVELGIELVDAKGMALGKTALEEKIKEVEEAASGGPATPKSDFDKFSDAVNAASKAADKIGDTDCPIAAGLVSTLYKKLADRIPVAAAA